MADREMPLKADTEKPHRCPACWQIPPQFYGGIMRLWRTYTCPDGHRFAKWRRPVWFLTWPLRRKIRSLGWRLEDWRWERRNG